SASRELLGLAEGFGNSESEKAGESGKREASTTEDLKKALMEGGSQEVAAIRQHCLKYAELVLLEEGEEQLRKVYQSIRSLCARSGLAGCGKIAQLTG